MTDTLFDLEPITTTPVVLLSAGQRLTLRNHQSIANGIHPATRQPLREGNEHCKTCAFLFPHGDSRRRFWKCRKHVRGFTFGAASDVRVNWPACALYERTSGS